MANRNFCNLLIMPQRKGYYLKRLLHKNRLILDTKLQHKSIC